jgi:hypothetical protein
MPHEPKISNTKTDAVELGTHGSPEELKEGYRAIWPAYLAKVAPLPTVGGVPMTVPAIAVGHVAGQVKASEVTTTSAPASPNVPSPDHPDSLAIGAP